MNAVVLVETQIREWAAENALEDEAYQRNQQTADDFPPGTSVLLTGDCRRWTVDTRYLNGDITLVRLPHHLYVTADQLWRIDPTR
ncbi:hypothetical protein [Rhodococcus sp. NPDC055024]